MRIVKIAGINKGTEELQLGTSRPADSVCPGANVTAMWSAAGLTPQLVVGAWTMIALALA